uniref:Calneuron 1 n=1 Tax=Cyprinus carpio carpio TaxID=630221 RepID=A0A9J8AXR9_CYPCA
MICQFRGVPGVRPERFEEGLTVKHCALSLLGEPIMYPDINSFLRLLHQQNISSFLVTNAQFPEEIRSLVPVTQLYVSIDASTKDSLKKIDRPFSKTSGSASWTVSEHLVKREKMPFHHVTAGLLYKGNFLSRSLSEHSNSEQLANISVEELDEIREAFRVLDRDGNGFISKQELGMAMRSLGYMPSEVELAIIMQRLDMDGDGQVDFDEFMTILGPKLLSSETREGFLGNTIDSIFWQFDMQRITLEELKHILFHAFRDHLTMKDIENIIINEEESLNENSGNCQTEFEGVHPKKKNRQTCVRKSLICAFAMAFIISVMLIAANQMLRNGME